MTGKFLSTKTFGHELGLSAVFRQHRAVHSHCSLLHGYALSFKFTFACTTLDERNWVQDFGGLKGLKELLQRTFDHKLVVAEDDPLKDEFGALAGLGAASVVVMPAVGCEAFAEYAFTLARDYMWNKCKGLPTDKRHRVKVVSCECSEHGANSAIYVHE
jgi:6-pyruvoyltetrahydropterin/6-carboxytetrahydropterin synthase